MDRGQTNQKTHPSTRAMAKIAGFMQRFGLECTPANFELIHSVMAGENSQLGEEFAQLGRDISQEDLNELIRKYASHHVDEGVAVDSLETVGKELSQFKSIVEKEGSDLAEYERLLKEQTRDLRNSEKVNPDMLKQSIASLSAATQRKIEQGKNIREAVSKQAARLDEVSDTLEQHKMQKLMDPLTGLPNRRAFNKEALTIFKDDHVVDCSMAFVEIDSFAAVRENYGALIADKFVLHVAEVLKDACAGKDYLARSSSHGFAMIFWGIANTTAESIARKFAHNIARAPLLNSSNGQPIGKVTVSTGICQSNQAQTTGDMLTKTEAVLKRAKAKNGGHVAIIDSGPSPDTDLERKDYSLYRI